MKTPAVIHPKPPKGWTVKTRRGQDPDWETFYAIIINPSGKVVTVCLVNEQGDEFCIRAEAKRAAIQEAHKLATP